MSYDYTEENSTRFEFLDKENFAKDRERFFSSRRTHLNKTEMIFSRRSRGFIAMDGRDRTLFEMNRRFI